MRKNSNIMFGDEVIMGPEYYQEKNDSPLTSNIQNHMIITMNSMVSNKKSHKCVVDKNIIDTLNFDKIKELAETINSMHKSKHYEEGNKLVKELNVLLYPILSFAYFKDHDVIAFYSHKHGIILTAHYSDVVEIIKKVLNEV